MHHIYHTEGIILESRGYGEAGKYYKILTPDFGLVFASAQGVRKITSKLRYVLSDYSHIKLDLVKGREMWRITNASKTGELENLKNNQIAIPVFVNISKLLIRLLAGEEGNEKLFKNLFQGLQILEKETEKEKIRNIEIILVLRILHQLGYVGAGEEVEEVLHSPFDDLLYSFSEKRNLVLKEVNKILRNTNM